MESDVECKKCLKDLIPMLRHKHHSRQHKTHARSTTRQQRIKVTLSNIYPSRDFRASDRVQQYTWTGRDCLRFMDAVLRSMTQLLWKNSYHIGGFQLVVTCIEDFHSHFISEPDAM